MPPFSQIPHSQRQPPFWFLTPSLPKPCYSWTFYHGIGACGLLGLTSSTQHNIYENHNSSSFYYNLVFQWMNRPWLFIPLPTDWLCFQLFGFWVWLFGFFCLFFAIINEASTGILLQVFFVNMFSFLLPKYLGVQLPSHRVVHV